MTSCQHLYTAHADEPAHPASRDAEPMSRESPQVTEGLLGLPPEEGHHERSEEKHRHACLRQEARRAHVDELACSVVKYDGEVEPAVNAEGYRWLEVQLFGHEWPKESDASEVEDDMRREIELDYQRGEKPFRPAQLGVDDDQHGRDHYRYEAVSERPVEAEQSVEIRQDGQRGEQ